MSARLKVSTLNCSHGIIEQHRHLFTFNLHCIQGLSVCAYLCVSSCTQATCMHASFSFCVHIYTHVYKQVQSTIAWSCSGKSMPSGWLVCAKSNMSPKYAVANGRSLTITRPASVCHRLCYCTLYIWLQPQFFLTSR